MKLLRSIKLSLIPVMASFCFTATATPNPVYCPQQITCTVGQENSISNCSIGGGWSINSVFYNTPNYFRPGVREFTFAAAQSFAGSAANCSYVYHSMDTTDYLGVILSNNNVVAMKKAPKKFSKWTDDGGSYYCYSQNVMYSKINNASSCPFQPSA